MGLFGKGSDSEANRAEFERLSALPLEDLGKEVMSHVQDVELGGILRHGPTADELAEVMAPSRLKVDEQVPMGSLVAEGLQVLEQAGLLRSGVHFKGTNSALEFVLTRAGLAALAQGDVSTRLGQAPR